LQTFCFGVAVATGCISWLSVHFEGIGHVPRAVELPGIAFASFLDRVPEALATSIVWPSGIINRLEGLLDNYQCPENHEYRVEIVNHSPVILRLRRFLPPGEATHLLRLAYVTTPRH
jgi:hypothetical protein